MFIFPALYVGLAILILEQFISFLCIDSCIGYYYRAVMHLQLVNTL